jgi:succinate dehydrogenase/fumarate reductase flavoprotein subunit
MRKSDINIKSIQTDVLVVGSGGAGFRAAIGACEKGASVLLVSKGRLARCGATPMAGADLTCHGKGMRAAGFFGEPRDSEDKFFSDIVHQGCFLNDQRLTDIYVKDGPDRLLEMLEWGMKVNISDERAIDAPGTAMVDAVYRQARRLGVNTLEDVAILGLYTRENEVIGALGLDLKAGEFLRIQAKAVILATGGCHKAYSVVTGSRELTGDGVAMALRAGAELTDMEFITFACNVIYWPTSHRGSIFTYVLSLVVGGELENSKGQLVYAQYDPWMVDYANKTEWNKSFISIISGKEIKAGNSLTHGGLRYISGRNSFDEFDQQVQASYKDWVFHCASFFDLREKMRNGEGIEVGPAAEYFEGGIAVNEANATSLPGLYAAGECASSVFGANRVAAATMEMLTTGARAGWAAGEYARSHGFWNIDPKQENRLLENILAPLFRVNGEKPSAIRKELQEHSQKLMGPVRNEIEMTEYLSFLYDLKSAEMSHMATSLKDVHYNKEWIEALDLINMVDTMQASCRASLFRKESRGVHYREDYPHVDNTNWLTEIVIQRNNEDWKISTRPVNTFKLSPPIGIIPYMDFTKNMMRSHSEIGGHH